MRHIFPLLAMLGCGTGPEADPGVDLDCDGESESQVMVMRTITFARASDDGISDGFDLDGQVSLEADPAGCYIGDYTDTEGTQGIDNGFARILPVLELTEASAIEPLIQSSINAGNVLLTVQLVDLDDPMNDACVDVRVGAAMGNPVIGSDDLIVPGQTFEWDSLADNQQVLDASIVDGRLDFALPQFSLDVRVLNADISLHLTDVRMRIDYDDVTGLWQGTLAGGLDGEQLLTIAASENVDPTIVTTLEGLLDITSDLAPNADGQCEKISVTLNFEAASAFYYDFEALE